MFMFCTEENEIEMLNTILEKRPFLDDFKKHYLDLCVWCYCNQREEFFKVVEQSEMMKNELNDLRDCFTEPAKIEN